MPIEFGKKWAILGEGKGPKFSPKMGLNKSLHVKKIIYLLNLWYFAYN
jgi:hypothetical protein